ncbi:MAG TPA: LLM class flavin-dependent oxidoreductase [Pseudonocardia sp.]
MAVPDIVFGFGADSRVTEPPDQDGTLLDLAQRADQDGLDVFSVADHPYLGDRLDAYAALGFVLGRTRHIAGFVNVSNLPIRTAPVLARTVTSLAALSGGRVVLGIGAGGRLDRIADMGAAALTPGQAVELLEESIVLIRSLSGGGPPVSTSGGHYRLQQIDPAPVEAPEVWTGSVGPRSLAVTGRVADGWIPGHAADWLSSRYRRSRPVIDEAAAGAGREPAAIRTVFNLPGRITARPLRETRDEGGRWLGGSADQWIEELTGAVLEHGARGFVLFTPDGGSPDGPTLSRWAREIAPAVREAGAG